MTTMRVILRGESGVAVRDTRLAVQDAGKPADAPEVVLWQKRLFLRRSVTTSVMTYWEIVPACLDGEPELPSPSSLISAPPGINSPEAAQMSLL